MARATIGQVSSARWSSAQAHRGTGDRTGGRVNVGGIADWFINLHTLEQRPDDLAFATIMVDDLLTRAISDEQGMRWSNYEFRNEHAALPPEPNYLQGASGIGGTLCRLDRHLRGDHRVVAWPHAPAWA